MTPPAVTAHHTERDTAKPSRPEHVTPKGRPAYWRQRVDVAPPGEPRRQQTVRAATRRELETRVAAVLAGRDRGELVARERHTVAAIVASFTAAKARDFDPTSALALANEFRPLLGRLGTRRAQQVTRDDIEALVGWCLAQGAVAKHDAAWERRAALANAALGAGPGGAKVAVLARGLDQRRAYQDLRALEQLGLVRRLPGKGWWAPAITAPVSAAGLAPAAGRLAPVTVANMLLSWRHAFARAVEDGKIARNPCAGVTVKVSRPVRQHWARDQLAAFIEAISGHRHEAIWRLFLLGLRRGEGAGLMWGDFGPGAPYGTVTISRELVRDRSAPAGWRIKPPKSPLSGRPLPLPDERTAGLLAARRRAEAAERLAAGPASICQLGGRPHSILQGDRRFACFDALVSAPERDGGQVPTLGTASCPAGRAVGAAFTEDGTRPTGEGAESQPQCRARRSAVTCGAPDRTGKPDIPASSAVRKRSLMILSSSSSTRRRAASLSATAPSCSATAASRSARCQRTCRCSVSIASIHPSFTTSTARVTSRAIALSRSISHAVRTTAAASCSETARGADASLA